MYDELIKDLREWPRICVEYTGSVDELHDKSADAIEELSAAVEGYESSTNMALVEKDGETVIEFQPKWIPVTERLPESGVPTLICGDGNVVEQGFFDDEYGYWYDWGGNRTFVHHWMPLPEPPKEE